MIDRKALREAIIKAHESEPGTHFGVYDKAGDAAEIDGWFSLDKLTDSIASAYELIARERAECTSKTTNTDLHKPGTLGGAPLRYWKNRPPQDHT